MVRNWIAGLALVMGLAAASQAAAQDRPVVVELFTSQGCSSCPPADAILHDLASDPNVIALALHVDYWDYIGWKDSFANPAFTKRQRRYASQQSERMVYTPQMMFNGIEHVVGNRKSNVREALKRHKTLAPVVDVAAQKKGNSVSIRLAPLSKTGDFTVFLVSYRAQSTVDIKRGENAGRKISYANVVTGWQKVGRWNGRSGKTITANGVPSQPMAVLVQNGDVGEIVGSAHVN